MLGLSCRGTRFGGNTHDNSVLPVSPLVANERLVPNLPRGRGKLIGGDLDIDDEGSE
jgi:hypothetical protein